MCIKTVVCETYEVVLISGGVLKPKLLSKPGQRAHFCKHIQKITKFATKPFNLLVKTYESETLTASRVNLTTEVQVKLDVSSVEKAMELSEHYGNLSQDQLESATENKIVKELEFQQHDIMSAMFLEDLYFNRRFFLTKVMEKSSGSLERAGFLIVSCHVVEVSDNNGSLEAMAQKARERDQRPSILDNSWSKKVEKMKVDLEKVNESTLKVLHHE